MSKKIVLIATVVALAAALAVPPGSATWFVHGTYEPDTDCDTADGCVVDGTPVAGGYMYGDADAAASGLKIYFNGFTDYAVVGVNPNSDVAGSRMNPNPEMSLGAYLGVWKDCNDDGYIGAAQGALHTYAAALIAPDTSICPDGSIFNRNGWVYEFIWIGSGDHVPGEGAQNYPAAEDQRWINDTSSLVWADFGRPASATAGTCPLASFPQGTFASTGGMIKWVDCIAGRRIVGAVNQVDADGSLGLRFEQVDAPQKSDSALNQKTINLFGDPYAGEDHETYQTGLLEKDSQKDRAYDYDPNTDYDPENTDKAFHVWDCGQSEAVVVASPVDDIVVADASGGDAEDLLFGESDGDLIIVSTRDDRGNMIYVAQLSPGVDNPSGSYYDALNHTERGMANPRNAGNVGTKDGEGQGNVAPSNCDTTNSTNVQNQYSGVETRAVGTATVLKRVTNEWFEFSLGGAPRGRILSADDRETIEERTGQTLPDEGAAINATLGEGYQAMVDYRTSGGVVQIFNSIFPNPEQRPGWNGFHAFTTNQHTVRGDGSPAPAAYTTFYARVGGTTLASGATYAKESPSVYGAEWCGSATSGASTLVPGYDCDASHWWKPEHGAAAMPTSLSTGRDIGAKVHDPYHLRDIDCYDGTLVRGTPAQASLTSLSQGGPCNDA